MYIDKQYDNTGCKLQYHQQPFIALGLEDIDLRNILREAAAALAAVGMLAVRGKTTPGERPFY